MCDPPKIKVDDAELLGKKVSQEEIETSIGQMENNKPRGPDGLAKKF